MLGRPVQQLGARLVRVWPVCGHDLVGLAAEHEVDRRRHRLGHGLGKLIAPVADHPASMIEALARVFLWTAGRLHDAVERREGEDDEISHRCLLLSYI